MTSLSTAILVFIAFLVGAAVGSFERADRRVAHEPPTTLQPSLRQLRQWRQERR